MRGLKPWTAWMVLGVALLAPLLMSCAAASVMTPDPTPLPAEPEAEEEDEEQDG